MNREYCRPYAYWAAFIAALGGFLSSYVTCVIAGSLCFICKEFSLSSFQEGFVASIILIGSLSGSCISGFLADRLGRRLSLLIAAFLYLISSLLIFPVTSLEALIILRFITGIAAGMSAMLCPLYLAEIAPPSKRGIFVTSFQFLITIGTLIAYLMNAAFAGTEDWRSMLAFAVIPAGFQAICLLFFPESPAWLLKTGKMEQAHIPLARLYGNTSLPAADPSETKMSWKGLFNPPLRFILILGLAVSFLQQGCGINAVIYFIPKIFTEAGFETSNTTIVAMLLIAAINSISTFCSFFLIDRLGRRKLLFISQLGVSCSLALLILSFVTQIKMIDIIAIAALMSYVACYSLGLGPVTWVFLSEIYPLSIRAKALSIMTIFSGISTYFVVLTFPSLVAELGITFAFTLYFFISLSGLWIFYRYIPETKGKSLEELEKLLE